MDRQMIALALILHTSSVYSQWICSQNSDCASLSGSLCIDGQCLCEPGQQAVLRGSACVNVAPYLSSPCVEDFQCGGLFTGFHCRKEENATEGNCMCQSDHHFYNGRCWRSIDFGQPCTTSDECMGHARDPFSLQCNVTCQCASGYFERQRGDCRKAALAVGEACVLDSDCQFAGGNCNPLSFVCRIGTGGSIVTPFRNMNIQTHANISRLPCNTNNTCVSPFVCSNIGICVCPPGYYESSNGGCLAELGSPSTQEQCVGFLAEVVDGICTCRNNFFFDENMRDCVKVSRFLNDSCTSDIACSSFGPARCSQPSAPFGLRMCECVDSVWDSNMNACRYFSGVGEICEVDTDCLAGDQIIQCVRNNEGVGVCTCPEGLIEFEGLCLQSGLELGDRCQHNNECGADNSECISGVCSCGEGYRQQDGEGQAICAPAIGGFCEVDNDCVIDNTVCKTNDNVDTCQCRDGFVAYEDVCLRASPGFNSSCTTSEQCILQSSLCIDGRCVCQNEHHYKDGNCWPMIGLFSPCSRSSECYLRDNSERVVCRNSACQCAFDYPYSDELETCTSSATGLMSTLFVLTTILTMLMR